MAFALDTASGAGHNHLPVLEDGIKVAHIDSPVHIAGMAALVPLEALADYKGFVAGSKVVADLVM